MHMDRQRLYTTVYCQCYSPCGKYLIAGDDLGMITVYSLQLVLSPGITKEGRTPLTTFKGHSGPIYSLISSDQQLISAGTGDIQGWSWTDIINKNPKAIWILSLPTESKFDSPETNSLALSCNQDSGETHLYAACGDKQAHIWDIETGSLLTSLLGHTEYIHDIVVRPGGKQCVTASEDGSVRIWDVRTGGEAVHVIEPYKNEDIARPQLGKWQGCVTLDTNNEWLVCGGGPHLTLYHLRSMTPTNVFKTSNTTHHTVLYHNDMILSGGSEPFIHHWSLEGNLKTKVPCSPNTVYSICANNKTEHYQILSASGSSNNIDIFTNPGYKAFSLRFR